MDLKSFRARSMPEALALVRRELGPDAAVLHTREVPGSAFSWLGGARQIEVIATADEVDIPSRVENLHGGQRQRFRDALAASASSGVELCSLDSKSEDRWQRVAMALADAGVNGERLAAFVGRLKAANANL